MDTNLDDGTLKGLLEKLGGAEQLSASARLHKAFVRAREIKSPVDLFRLIMLYGPGGNSLRISAAMAAARGTADLSDVALLERFERSADWLEALCQERLNQIGREAGVGAHALRLIDGSRIEGPRDTAWRLHLCYAPFGPGTVEAAITPLKVGERLDSLPATKGEIRIGDRGYPQPEGIAATIRAGADLLVRLTWSSLALRDKHGHKLDWAALFGASTADGFVDMPVVLRDKNYKPIRLRLVLLRKPPEAAEASRKAAERASQRKGHVIDPMTLLAAEHLILLTSLKQETPEALGGLYRLRWQIELVFKRLKSLLHMDRLPAKSPDLARTWLHAHLLFALLIEDIHAELDADPP